MYLDLEITTCETTTINNDGYDNNDNENYMGWCNAKDCKSYDSLGDTILMFVGRYILSIRNEHETVLGVILSKYNSRNYT